MTVPLTRDPVRIAQQGTFPLPGLNARYTLGHDAVGETLPELFASPMLGVDIESAGGVKPWNRRKQLDCKSVQISTADHAVLFDPRDPAQFAMIRDVLNGTDAVLAFHNSPFDTPNLYLLGLLDLASVARIVDTLIYARMAEPDERTRKGLANCAARYLGATGADPLPGILKTLGISKTTWYEEKDLDTPAYRLMAATDPIFTHRLVPVTRQAAFDRLTTGHPFPRTGVHGDDAWREVEKHQTLNRTHLARSCKGFAVDPDYLDAYRDRTSAELTRVEAELQREGIRPGNAGDLTSWLSDRDLLPEGYPVTDKTKKPSGAKEHLETLGHPIAQTFVYHKETTHVLRDYLDKAWNNAIEGRVHPTTSMLSAATGRMSMSGDIPVHQFAPDARGILLADDHATCAPLTHGVKERCDCPHPSGMVSIDWSQIEPVLVANMAGDMHAVEYYEQGNKFYDVLVEFGGLEYAPAKQALLAQLYGQGIRLLSSKLDITQQEAYALRDKIWEVLPQTRELAGKNGKLQRVARKHRMICTLAGRIVPVPAGWRKCWEDHETKDDIAYCDKCNSSGSIFNVHEHKGVNYYVQGGAFDLLAEAELSIIEHGMGDAIYFAMHDELVVDHEAAHAIRKIMETPPARLIELSGRTPVLRTDMAHLGERWAAA